MGLFPSTPAAIDKAVSNATQSAGDGPGNISAGEYKEIQSKFNYMWGGGLGRYSAGTLLNVGGHAELATALSQKMDYAGYCKLVSGTSE